MNASNQYIKARDSSEKKNDYNFTKFEPSNTKNEENVAKVKYVRNFKSRTDPSAKHSDNNKNTRWEQNNPPKSNPYLNTDPGTQNEIEQDSNDSFIELNKLEAPSNIGRDNYGDRRYSDPTMDSPRDKFNKKNRGPNVFGERRNP